MANKDIFHSSSQNNKSEVNLSHQYKCNNDYSNIENLEQSIKRPNSPDLSDEFYINMLSKNTNSPKSKTDNTVAQSVNNLNTGNDGSCIPDVQTFSEEVKSQDSSNAVGNFANDPNSTLKISDFPSPVGMLSPVLKDITDKQETDHSINGSIEVKVSEEKNEIKRAEIEESESKSIEGASQSYRDETDSWLEEESSSSTLSLDSDSDCDDSFFDQMRKRGNAVENKIINIKTKGELDLDELPPIENLHITLPANEVEKCGKIHAIVDKLVIVHAFKDLPPLDLDSVLFLSPEKVLGRIFDVFGPVAEPFYSVRFNNVQEIADAEIVPDLDVFYAPRKKEITSYVFVDELRLQKGSDASWTDNNEPPEEFLDYSDDEQEKAAKQKRRAKNRLNKALNNDQAEKSEEESVSPIRQKPHNSNMHYNRTVPTVINSFSVNRSNTTSVSAYPSVKAVMSSTYKNTSSGFNETSRNSFPIYRPFAPEQPNVPNNHQRNLSGQPLFRPAQPFAVPCLPNPVLQAVPVYRPARPILQFQQQNIPSTFMQHPQVITSRAVGTVGQPQRQPHVFGQVPPLNAMSPAFSQTSFPPPALPQVPFPSPAISQSPFSSPAISASPFPSPVIPGSPFPSPAIPTVPFPPPAMSPAPLLSISFPPTSPNFSYFSHGHVAASSPPPPRPTMSPNSHWLPRQPVGPQLANMRVMPPMSPLSIEIPNNLKSPPPSLPISSANTYFGITPMQPVQHAQRFTYMQRY